MNDKKQINITVSGTSNVGKSRIMSYLINLLEKDGFNVVLEGNWDYLTKEELSNSVSDNFLEVIQIIKENVTIGFKEKVEYFDIVSQKHEIKPEHTCRYSKAMYQESPRKCIICKNPEK